MGDELPAAVHTPIGATPSLGKCTMAGNWSASLPARGALNMPEPILITVVIDHSGHIPIEG